MTLIDILTLVAFFAVGWFIGAKVTTYLLGQAFKSILEDLDINADHLKKLAGKYGMKLAKIEKDEVTGEEHEVVEVKIEQHHGELYAFRKADDKFLGQGATREELIERLKHHFSGTITMVVRESDGAELIKLPS